MLRFRKSRKQRGIVLPRFHLRVRNRESIRSEPDRRIHEFRPRFMPILLMREFQAANGSRNTNRPPADRTFVSRLPAGIKIHISACAGGSLLAKIYERRSPICEADQHESATAYVAGVRMSDCKREAHVDSSVYCIAPGS